MTLYEIDRSQCMTSTASYDSEQLIGILAEGMKNYSALNNPFSTQ